MAEKSSGPYKLDNLKVKPQLGPEGKTEKFGVYLFELFHSFGYQCVGSPNICVVDANTVVLASGSTVILIDLKKNQHKYLPTISGGGVGHIVLHPKKQIFAVAEKGCQPSINFFVHPGLHLSKMLHGGTERVYVYLQFNPKGDLLASVGGPPDYSITVWQWEKETILLKSKAFSQDVWAVSFSPYLEGQLTTSGVGHIKFWKMAHSYTGLKLQGEIGRFGQIEISDIHSSIHLADGKVISSSEWGFLLIWDGGMVHAQVRRTNGKPCHQGAIHQLILEEGDLITLGADGWIRIWDVESMESAEPEEEAGFLELDPVNELLISKKAKLTHMVPVPGSKEKNMWFVQNANGSIWLVDLSFSLTSKVPECVLTYPGIGVSGCEMCPTCPLFAVSAMDGTVHIFNCLSKTTLCSTEFNAGASSLLWASEKVDSDGASLFAGFADGTLRWLGIISTGSQYSEEYQLCLNQVLKPHTDAIICLGINSSGTFLTTCGLDRVVFFFEIQDKHLLPLGYVHLQNPIKWLLWFEEEEKETVLVSCENSCLVKIDAPDPACLEEDRISYLLKGIRLITYKVGRMRSYWKLAKKKEEEIPPEDIEGASEAVETTDGENAELVESTEEEAVVEAPVEEVIEEIEEDLHPDISPSILCSIKSDQPGHLWLSLGDYDTGYIYEFSFVADDDCVQPIDLVPVRVAELLISEKQSVFAANMSPCGRYLFMGQEDGTLSVYNLETPWDMTSITEYWKAGCHDLQYGLIQFICVSKDGRLLITAGKDDNIFLHKFNAPEYKRKLSITKKFSIPIFSLEEEVVDIIGEETLSIEQAFQKEKEVERLQHLELKCQILNEEIDNLSKELQNYIDENITLPDHMQIDTHKYLMHPRIAEDLLKRSEENIELVRKQMAWKLEWQTLALKKLHDRFNRPIQTEHICSKSFFTGEEVTTFRLTHLPEIESSILEVEEESSLSEEAAESATDAGVQDAVSDDVTRSVITPTVASTVYDYEEGIEDTAAPLSKAQQRYEERKQQKAARKAEWDALMSAKPESGDDSSGEDELIKSAKETLGDYKLKTDPNYVVPEHGRMNAAMKKEQILNIYKMNQNRMKTINSAILSHHECKSALGILQPESEHTVEDTKTHSSLASDKSSQKSSEQHSTAEESASEELQQEKSDVSSEHSIASSVEIPTEVLPVAKTKVEEKLFAMNNFRQNYFDKKQSEEQQQVLTFFDSELHLLRIEKTTLDTEVKYADTRYINLLQELEVLQSSDQQEQILQDRVALKFSEKENLTQKLYQIDQDTKDAKQMMTTLKTQEKEVYAALMKVLGEGNKFAKFLTRLFKKRIRQAKKEKEDEGEESDESDFSDDDYSSEDEQPGAMILESDIDPILLHSVNVLRERRQNIDDSLKREQKSIDSLKKERDAVTKKCKLIDASLQIANREMENFQFEKQLEMNKLNVVICLMMHQIISFSLSLLPDIFDFLLIFYSSGLSELTERVIQLREEASQERHYQREIHHQHVRLGNECQHLEDQVAKKKSVCHREMVDKFGQDVDLDFLEELESNPQTEQLRKQQRELQVQQEETIIQCKEKVANKKIELLAITKENTKYLKLLSALKEERNQLCKGLERRQKQL